MLQAKGLVVIGEVRRPTKFPVYTSVTSDQVNRLLDAGVPSANITVAGHSKGGLTKEKYDEQTDPLLQKLGIK